MIYRQAVEVARSMNSRSRRSFRGAKKTRIGWVAYRTPLPRSPGAAQGRVAGGYVKARSQRFFTYGAFYVRDGE
jgi:hypothetical protein